MFSNPATPYATGRKISLSLSDLMVSEKKPQHKLNESVQSTFSSTAYKTELAKLLKKSKGTQYEATLRRFVEDKYRDMQEDELRRSQTTISPKQSLATLSMSKYDISLDQLSLRDKLRGTDVWLNDLAKPKSTSKMPSTEEKPSHRRSTNHVGRQRPPPTYDTTSTTPFLRHRSASPHRFNYSAVSASGEHSVDGGGGNSRGKYRIQEAPQPPDTTVTEREFEEWVVNNQKWVQQKEIKYQKLCEKFGPKPEDIVFQPKLTTKSVKLAEIAQQKEINKLLADEPKTQNTNQINILLQSTQPQNPNYPYPSPDRPKSPDFPPQNPDIPQIPTFSSQNSIASNNSVSSVREIKDGRNNDLSASQQIDVYQRLALRGRDFARKRKENPSPAPMRAPSPMSQHSRKLAERKRRRDFQEYHTEQDFSNSYTLEPVEKDTPKTKRDRSLSIRSRVPPPPPPEGSPSVGTREGSLGSSGTRGKTTRVQPFHASVHSPTKSRRNSLMSEKENLKTTSERHLITRSDYAKFHIPKYMKETVVKKREYLKGHGISSVPNDRLTLSDEETQDSTQYQELRGRSRQSRYGTNSSQANDPATPPEKSKGELNRRLWLVAQEGIRKSRSLSAQRQERRMQEKQQKYYGHLSKEVIDKLHLQSGKTTDEFHPPVLAAAKESNKLLSRKRTSFKERNALSLESRMIRREIAKRSPSPGPGHYTHSILTPLSTASARTTTLTFDTAAASNTATKSVITVGTGKNSSIGGSRRSSGPNMPSPGKQGFSFGKAKLNREEIGDNKTTYIARISPVKK